MQNDVGKTIGVSPAYFLSLHGPLFSPEDVVGALEGLKSRGFAAVQLEVFDPSVLPRWVEGGMALVAGEARRKDLRVSAFVAHFLGSPVSSPADTGGKKGMEQFREILDMMELLPVSVPLVLPLLPCPVATPELKQAALEKLCLWADQTAGRGRRMALEIVPGSLAGSYSGFLSEPFWQELASKTGLLLDTGHAHVTGEDIPELIRSMSGRLEALHLSDNDGRENLSLIPGKGSVDWRAVLGALDDMGFAGSLDLEISAPPGLVAGAYGKGRDYLLNHTAGLKTERAGKSGIAV